MPTVRSRLINFKVTPAEYEAIQALAAAHFGENGISKWLRMRGLSETTAAHECPCPSCTAARFGNLNKGTIHGQSG